MGRKKKIQNLNTQDFYNNYDFNKNDKNDKNIKKNKNINNNIFNTNKSIAIINDTLSKIKINDITFYRNSYNCLLNENLEIIGLYENNDDIFTYYLF